MAHHERLQDYENVRTVKGMTHLEAVGHLDYVFAADRPLMAKSNREISSVVNLLHGEIFELNGKTEDGMSLEDYRAQEISDIQYFAFTLAKAVGYPLSQSYLDIFLKKHHLVMPTQSRTEVGYEYEDTYVELKKSLREAADQLYATPDHDTVIEARKIGPIAQKIMNIAYALHALLGRNSTEEMRDKGARNALKHSPAGYDDVDGDYNAVVKAKGIAWKENARSNPRGGGNRGFFDRQWGISSEHVLPSPEFLLTSNTLTDTFDQKEEVTEVAVAETLVQKIGLR